MTDSTTRSNVYHQVDALRAHLQNALDEYDAQIKPDINLAAEAFDVLWQTSQDFQRCASASILNTPVAYSPSPSQAYFTASYMKPEIAGLRILRPSECENLASFGTSAENRSMIDYVEEVRREIPTYDGIMTQMHAKKAAVYDILRDARRVSESGLLEREGLSVDGYIVATVCIPENMPTPYHRIIQEEGLASMSICNGQNIISAKAELRFLCDSAESCDSLVNGLPRLKSAAQGR